MPNHVRTSLIFTGDAEEIKNLRKKVETEENYFDFNAIVPEPKELLDRQPDTNDEKTKELVAKYGYDNWYDWRRHNWGTKWNQYGEDFYEEGWVADNEVMIVTAWSCPGAVLIALSKMFPNVTISYMFADEDAGYNVGRGQIHDGEVEEENIKEASEMAFDIYFELHPEMEEDYTIEPNGDGTFSLVERECEDEMEEEEEEDDMEEEEEEEEE